MLYKPPLLIWFAAALVKLFGTGAIPLRLPSLIAAVLATAVVFYWCNRTCSFVAGLAAVTLLLSDALWHIFARLCYTDMIWVCLTTCALCCLYFDPQLARTRSVIVFGAAVGLGVMVVVYRSVSRETGPIGMRPAA